MKNDMKNPHAQHVADEAPKSASKIALGGFDEHGTYRQTVHPGMTAISTGILIDLYAIQRMIVAVSRHRVGDPERVRLSQLATWSETLLLIALAGGNPEYDDNWFDTAAGVWRNSSDGRRDR